MAGLCRRRPPACAPHVVEAVIIRFHPLLPALIVSILMWAAIIVGVQALIGYFKGTKEMEFIGSHERLAYTVEHRDNCVLVTGPVPVRAVGALSKLVPDGSVLDHELGKALGATFALGLPDDLMKLRIAHRKIN